MIEPKLRKKSDFKSKQVLIPSFLTDIFNNSATLCAILTVTGDVVKCMAAPQLVSIWCGFTDFSGAMLCYTLARVVARRG